MARQSAIRASDADRDAVASRLREAAVDGRLEAWEFEERLGAALQARTYGELDRLLGDLPGRSVPRRRSVSSRTVFVLALRLVVALVIVAALVTVLAVTAVWWMIGLLVWLTVRAGRGSCRVRAGRSVWHQHPRAWRA